MFNQSRYNSTIIRDINEPPPPRKRPPFRFNRLLANANAACNQTGGTRGRQMARGNILTAVIAPSLHFSVKAKPTPAGGRHPRTRPRTRRRDEGVGIDGNPASRSRQCGRQTSPRLLSSMRYPRISARSFADVSGNSRARLMPPPHYDILKLLFLFFEKREKE